MSNYIDSKIEISNDITAGIPLIILDTCERERAERMLMEIAEERCQEISYWTDSKGLVTWPDGSLSTIDDDLIDFVTKKFRNNRNSIFAIGDINRVNDENIFSRDILNLLYQALESASTLILITNDIVWSKISNFGVVVTLDYLDAEERVSLINSFISTYKNKFTIDWDEQDILMAATMLRGFTEVQINNILSYELVHNEGLTKDIIPMLTYQKRKLYPAVSCVYPVNVDKNVSVCGLDNLKNWLNDKKAVFFAKEESLKTWNIKPPKGILLAGVPGCGKSFSAKMVASKWELPLYRFDIGSIYDKWVGESEKKMRDALTFIDNVSPCVVWIDEIEKALAISDTGNDTGKRILGQFLFWLQESTSRVFLVATANDITLLPVELFRKGRFSEIFFIDLPNEAERLDAIEHYISTSLHLEASNEDLDKFVKATDGFSYSDIECAIKDIAQKALIHGDSVVNTKNILENFDNVVSIKENNPELISKVQNWGAERAINASN